MHVLYGTRCHALALLLQKESHPRKDPGILGLVGRHGYLHQQPFTIQGEIQWRLDGLISLKKLKRKRDNPKTNAQRHRIQFIKKRHKINRDAINWCKDPT